MDTTVLITHNAQPHHRSPLRPAREGELFDFNANRCTLVKASSTATLKVYQRK